MYKKITSVLGILLLTGISSLYGQSADTEGRGGSVYSYFGLGQPVDLTSDNFKAQGLLGVSGTSIETMSLNNPALWGRAFYTEGTTGFQLMKHNMSNTSASSQNFNLQSGFVHILVPLSKDKAGLSIGLYPVTRANFRALNQESLVLGPADTLRYSNDIQSQGGVSKFEIGFGVKLTRNISVGYAPSLAFLTLKNTEYLTFSNSLSVQDLRLNINGTSFSQRFGIAGNFNRLFKSDDRLNIGATLNVPFTIGAQSEYSTNKQVNGQQEEIDLTNTLSNPEGDVEMPLESSFGLGYSPSPFLSIAFEGVYQKWGDFSNEIKPEESDMLKDRLKVGLGGQFHPYKRNSDKFLSRFKYSAGLSYDTGHLTISGNDISTLWFNTGIGFLSRTTSSVDVSFQYGFRGTTNDNLIQERIWALGISVNLTELMFVRPKLR